MLYPSKGRGATVTVTLPSGETVSGALAYRDEFTIALVDATGWHRSWPTSAVRISVDDPLDVLLERVRVDELNAAAVFAAIDEVLRAAPERVVRLVEGIDLAIAVIVDTDVEPHLGHPLGMSHGACP